MKEFNTTWELFSHSTKHNINLNNIIKIITGKESKSSAVFVHIVIKFYLLSVCSQVGAVLYLYMFIFTLHCSTAWDAYSIGCDYAQRYTYIQVCTSQKKLKLRLVTFLPEMCANSCLTPGATFFQCVTLIHSVYDDASFSFLNTDEEFATGNSYWRPPLLLLNS